jgi:hypothetical protein
MHGRSDLTSVERLEIIAACERLILDYAHFADQCEYDRWACLFCEDGEFHHFGKVHVGRKRIREATGVRPTFPMHVMTNIRVDVIDHITATGTSYVTGYTRLREGSRLVPTVTPWAIGHYQDRYRLTSDGWRIAVRKLELFLTTRPDTA